MILRNYQDADVRTLRRRRWQRDLESMRGDVRGFGEMDDEVGPVSGGVTAASSTASRSPGEAIFIGVSTGVLVWAITNFLNKVFGGGK